MRRQARDSLVPREVLALLSQERLIVRETQRAVTPFGGMAVFVEFLRRIDLIGQIRRYMPIRWRSPNRIDPTATLTAFLLAVLLGARRFVHANWLRGDRALHALLGIARFPSDDTIRNLFRRFGMGEVHQLYAPLSEWQMERLPQRREGYSLDLDSTRYGQAIQFYSCFISYSTQDQDFADRVHADLQSKGVRCWFAPHDVKGGRKIHEQIDEAIRLYDKLLLILSRNSMKSEWVKTEIAKARKREVRDRGRVLFPIGLTSFDAIREWEAFDADIGKDMAREIREYFIPDFSNWKDQASYQKAFDRLVNDLKADEGARERPPQPKL